MRHDETAELGWRLPLAHLRWLLIGSVCAAAPGCGGKASLDGAGASDGTPEDVLASAGASGASGGTHGGTAGSGSGGASGAGAGSSGASSGGGSAVDLPFGLLALQCLPARDGWERCNGGSVLHRVAVVRCPSQLPRGFQIANTIPDAGYFNECERDSDCAERPHGQCSAEGNNSYCSYGCTRDEECGAGHVCVCGDLIGECRYALCNSDAHCPSGLGCTAYDTQSCGGGYQLSCQTVGDECIGDDDCPGQVCGVSGPPDMRRRCAPVEPCPVPGRPFLIDGEARRASVVVRGDWGCTTSDTAELSSSLRAALGAHWLEQGLMEHASVAAFARFTLQLLSVGAPSELVSASSRAMQDEIAHAEACFAQARRYSGQSRGPGPLPLDGALTRPDLWSIVHDTVLEGCIGETVAAVEAGEASARCEDGAVRPLLERIAREEYQHAALAWRFVRWALEREPGLRSRVHALFECTLSERGAGVELALEPEAAELAHHGVISAELRRRLERRVLREVIAPCVDALCSTARAGRAPLQPLV